jgi:hypothetical protein
MHLLGPALFHLMLVSSVVAKLSFLRAAFTLSMIPSEIPYLIEIERTVVHTLGHQILPK